MGIINLQGQIFAANFLLLGVHSWKDRERGQQKDPASLTGAVSFTVVSRKHSAWEAGEWHNQASDHIEMMCRVLRLRKETNTNYGARLSIQLPRRAWDTDAWDPPTETMI